ncbi:sec23 sec24 helical domain-containing protein [Cyclospora cayetanensis]|uniref:Sec23 sec24 helical domain-containing protein n=1 Tax=Cyclospora cayetanensis TaxID=88456 RepID=A0A1D3D7F0_9EIME|nr:sec23 sec24 helical domain-containing protein [Cyclospora cayetanensis]
MSFPSQPYAADQQPQQGQPQQPRQWHQQPQQGQPQQGQPQQGQPHQQPYQQPSYDALYGGYTQQQLHQRAPSLTAVGTGSFPPSTTQNGTAGVVEKTELSQKQQPSEKPVEDMPPLQPLARPINNRIDPAHIPRPDWSGTFAPVATIMAVACLSAAGDMTRIVCRFLVFCVYACACASAHPPGRLPMRH